MEVSPVAKNPVRLLPASELTSPKGALPPLILQVSRRLSADPSSMAGLFAGLQTIDEESNTSRRSNRSRYGLVATGHRTRVLLVKARANTLPLLLSGPW